MPARFHWNYDLEMQELMNRRLEQDRREQIASTIQPDYGDRTAAIMSRYPWLSPGAIVAAVKDGWDDTAPQIGAIADIEFQRRSSQQDWAFPGDTIRSKGVPTYKLFGGGKGGEKPSAAQEEPQASPEASAVQPGGQGPPEAIPGQAPGTPTI